MLSSSTTEGGVHPMVPVPDALRTVLRCTAEMLLDSSDPGSSSSSDADADGGGGVGVSKKKGSNDNDGAFVETLSPSSSSSSSYYGGGCIDRISSSNVTVPEPGYPPYDASIMDGYAVVCSELVQPKEEGGGDGEEEDGGYTHDVVGKVYAGDDPAFSSSSSKVVDKETTTTGRHQRKRRPTALYVTTGAVVPAPYDAVIPVEDSILSTSPSAASDERVGVKFTCNLSGVKAGKWIRKIGCDLTPGHVILNQGEVIQPVHWGLLAQVGVDEVYVRRLPRVGVLSTGNEIISSPSGSGGSGSDGAASTAAAAGLIPDANRPVLLSQLASYRNCIPVDLGIVNDDDVATFASTVRRALYGTGAADGDDDEGCCDVVVTTGGISMGEKDIVEDVLVNQLHGRVRFGRIHMKPGKPTTFVTLDDEEDSEDGGSGGSCNDSRNSKRRRRRRRRKLVFALPGNPVSASVCAELLVKPCLDLLHEGIVPPVDHEEEGEATVEAAKEGDKRNLDAREEVLRRIVNGAGVHREVVATLSSDVKLDMERPEYHRVRLSLRSHSSSSSEGDCYYSYEATTTGVQRSSRLESMRGADGLMVLPQGREGKTMAKKGERYTVLLLIRSASGTNERMRLEDSRHVGGGGRNDNKNTTGVLRVGLVYVVDAASNKGTVTTGPGGIDPSRLAALERTVVDSFGGTGASRVVWSKCVDGTAAAGRAKLAAAAGPEEEDNIVDVRVVVCSGAMPFQDTLEVSSSLRTKLTKVADAMALQARRGAALHHSSAALFEVVVGYAAHEDELWMCLPERGLEGALTSTRGLLSHALSVARGHRGGSGSGSGKSKDRSHHHQHHHSHRHQ